MKTWCSHLFIFKCSIINVKTSRIVSKFFKKLKPYTKLVPETVRKVVISKLICNQLYISPSSTKVFFYNRNITLNYCATVKSTSVLTFPKISPVYLICLTYFFLYSHWLQHFTPLLVFCGNFISCIIICYWLFLLFLFCE